MPASVYKPTKADPARALQRFAAVSPWRWFTHPTVAVVPALVLGYWWLAPNADALVRTNVAYSLFLCGLWFVSVLLTRATMMGPNRNFVAFYPERLAWFRGQHTLLVDRVNVESYTREPARGPLAGILALFCHEPVAEHFRLHLYSRGLLGYNHLGQGNVDLRAIIPLEVVELDAFEAALRAWLARPFGPT